MRVAITIKQREVHVNLQSNYVDSTKEDIFVTITLYRVPGDLVQNFIRHVAVNCPGGVSEAVQILMREALKK
jgi:glucose-6-phosphate-specific signal transduction histidine kinase